MTVLKKNTLLDTDSSNGRYNGKPKGPVIADNEGHDLAQKMAEIQQQLAEIERRKIEADQQAIKHQEAEYYELIDNANRFRQDAANATDDAQRKQLLTYAFDAERQAEDLGQQLGIVHEKSWLQKAMQAVAEWFQSWKAKSEWYVPFVQVTGLLVVIAWCYHKFFSMRDEILAYNSSVETYDQIRPLGMDSIQKMYLMFLNVGFDVVFVLGILGIFSPKMLLYLLPFLRSKDDFSHDFETKTTAWQRLLIVSAYLLGLLLYLSFSHMGKSV